MNPILFQLGDFSIRWYSVLILVGILVAFLLAIKEGRKIGLSKDFVFDLGFWIIVFGLIGARLYYVLFNFSYYKDDFWEIVKVWNGGLAIHGGIIAGFITLVIYCKKHHVSIFKVTDLVVPSLLLAQAIGRWGNFFNSEAHGPFTTLENLQHLHIPNFIIKGMYIDGVYYHPTFLYESIWCFIGFVLVILVRNLFKQRKVGELTCFYLMWYSLGRFFIESLRTDSLMISSLKMAQIVSILLFICGFIGFIVLFVFRLRKNKEMVK